MVVQRAGWKGRSKEEEEEDEEQEQERQNDQNFKTYRLCHYNGADHARPRVALLTGRYKVVRHDWSG